MMMSDLNDDGDDLEGRVWFKCCLCDKVMEGYGNNPDPLVIDDDAECCDDCNSTKVIPARLAQMFGGKYE